MPRLLRTVWRPLGRRLGAGFALVAYLAAAAGLPCTVPPDKDRSQPFPCRNHCCGCRSAADCWHYCCCYSREERVAWARDHGVTPPAPVAEPVVAGWNTPRLRDRDEGRAPAPAPDCPECARRAAADASPPSRADACCAGKEQPGQRAANSCPPATRDAWRAALCSLHCHRPATVWISTGAVLPPPPRPAWNPYILPVGSLSHADVSALALASTPPDPPPRALHV